MKSKLPKSGATFFLFFATDAQILLLDIHILKIYQKLVLVDPLSLSFINNIHLTSWLLRGVYLTLWLLRGVANLLSEAILPK